MTTVKNASNTAISTQPSWQRHPHPAAAAGHNNAELHGALRWHLATLTTDRTSKVAPTTSANSTNSSKHTTSEHVPDAQYLTQPFITLRYAVPYQYKLLIANPAT